jgi:hypothetical protein
MIGGAAFPGYKILFQISESDNPNIQIDLTNYVDYFLYELQFNPEIKGSPCGFIVQSNCILRLVKLDGGDAETAPAPIFIYPDTMFFMNMNLEDMKDWAIWVDQNNTPGFPSPSEFTIYFMGQN